MLRKWERQEIARKADAARVIMRANEIAAGATLKFDQKIMEEALRAHIQSLSNWWKFRGDVHDFLQTTGVDTVFGTP